MNGVAKRVLTGLSVGGCVIAAILLAPPCAFRPVCLVLATLSLIEVVQLTSIKARQSKVAWLVGALLGVLVVAMFTVLPAIARVYGGVMLLYVVAIVKFSDVGGFAFGLTAAKLTNGKTHKLCPSISPNKSWEGLVGSIVFSCVVSAGFMPCTGFGLAKALAFGLLAALVGTFGDLVESKFKRWVGVKDSSTMRLTNGMGGFLDMFDSLTFAPGLLFFLI